MLTAREKFQQSGHALAHKKWAESLDGEAATDYALLALVEELPEDALSGASANDKLIGAKRYRDLLLNLHKERIQTKREGILGPNLKPPS